MIALDDLRWRCMHTPSVMMQWRTISPCASLSLKAIGGEPSHSAGMVLVSQISIPNLDFRSSTVFVGMRKGEWRAPFIVMSQRGSGETSARKGGEWVR